MILIINFFFLILTLSSLLSNQLLAQTSNKDTNTFHPRLAKTYIDEIRKGVHLELAKTYSLENFIEYYMDNSIKRYDKKYDYFLFDTLYSDSLYLYFGYRNSYFLVNFFKVSHNDLAGINYKEIIVKNIQNIFIEEVIPTADKERVERKDWGCTASSVRQDFSYRYFRNTKEIEITYKWKEVCDFVAKLIDKTYIALYNLDTKSFSQVSFYNEKEGNRKVKNKFD